MLSLTIRLPFWERVRLLVSGKVHVRVTSLGRIEWWLERGQKHVTRGAV